MIDGKAYLWVVEIQFEPTQIDGEEWDTIEYRVVAKDYIQASSTAWATFFKEAACVAHPDIVRMERLDEVDAVAAEAL